jgi:hypothetical protein
LLAVLSRVYKWSVNSFTNPNPIYSHTYFMTSSFRSGRIGNCTGSLYRHTTRIKKMEQMMTESESKPQEVPKEKVAMNTVSALKKQYGDQHLAIGRCRQTKKRTQGNGGSWKKLATTHHAGVAQHKGHGHTGPTVEQRRRKNQT